VDASWALNHPEKAIDFGYRAIHATAVTAKAVIAAFYGGQPRRSYFSSCSNGGRQGLMEAQRYPDDYDGIVSGAPANYWTHVVTVGVWDALALSGDGYIPASKIPAIEAAALAACDATDGLKDGLISDPARCHFDLKTLVCQGPDSAACLSAPQAAALEKLYSGPRNAKGESTFPGHMPGGESGVGGWAAWITGPAPEKSLGYGFGTQFFANMVFANAGWDYHTFQVDRDTRAADEKMARVLNATDPDLSRFRQRGGKLILYHGWSDAAISPVNTIDYFHSVEKKLGARETEGCVRLFMVPGLEHCSDGPGPNSFGQAGAPQGDASQNIDKAVEHWVEDGVAPDRIIATKYRNGSNAASGVLRTRPLCPYPQVAQYKGSGSIDDAASFVCAAPR
jgi:feruloyl esterase